MQQLSPDYLWDWLMRELQKGQINNKIRTKYINKIFILYLE